MAGRVLVHDPFPVHGCTPAIEQGRGHGREIRDGGQDGALARVAGDHLMRVIGNDLVLAQHVGHGQVVIRRAQLGSEYLFIDGQLASS